MAEVRHVNRPFRVRIAVLDDSEALIHYTEPDSPNLTDSACDVAIHVTNKPIVVNLLRMLESIWQKAVPVERKLRGPTPARVVSV